MREKGGGLELWQCHDISGGNLDVLSTYLQDALGFNSMSCQHTEVKASRVALAVTS